MNNSHLHYADSQIDSALRSLDAAGLPDAADPADLRSDLLGSRAAADLDAILATGPGVPAGEVGGTRRRRRRDPGVPGFTSNAPRRVALIGAAAAVVALAIVAVPTLLPDGDSGFTSWAAVPQQLAPDQRPEAGVACRESYGDGPGDYGAYLDSAQVAVAERRGAWVTVVLSGADGFTATCISDDTARPFSGGMIGSIGTSAEVADPDLRGVWPTSLGVGTVSGRDLSMISGVVGADVVGVTYSSAEHGEVVATVSEGRFALWMPGDELRDAHRDGAEVRVWFADGGSEIVRLSY